MGKNGDEDDDVKMQAQGMNPDAETSSDDTEEAPGRPDKHRGVPLFPPNVVNAIVKKALAGARHVDLAREYNTRPENIGRWVKTYLERNKRTPSAKGKGYVFNSGGSLPKDVPTTNAPLSEHSEVDKLREELRRVHEAFGRVSLERDQLREKLNYRSRRGD